MTTIFHNPRCSKSRQTLQLLQDNNITSDVREYLKQKPSQAEITDLLTALGIPASQLIRSKEKLLKELDIKVANLSTIEAVALMAEHPILIERPIVVHQGRAKIGRPPEDVLELFTK